jgi:hypothetical protein
VSAAPDHDDIVTRIRTACAQVAAAAAAVRIEHDAIEPYAASLPVVAEPWPPDPAAHLIGADRATTAAFWLTLDAINFGSGWFPTLRKREGRSGYYTVAMGVTERFRADGVWTAAELATIGAREIAAVVGQDPEHELMAPFARALNDLGRHVSDEFGGSFEAVIDAADGSAVALAERISQWDCFTDASTYGRLEVPFLKRAQITAADLDASGAAAFGDRRRLTIFADNLVPHVLRLDGVLRFDSDLVDRIDRGVLIEHGSPEEVEIRACALHAVELLVAARPGSCAADIDQLLWHRGQRPTYKASPRHRSRCTAY